MGKIIGINLNIGLSSPFYGDMETQSRHFVQKIHHELNQNFCKYLHKMPIFT
jgi:hypothetical protein